MNAAQSNFYTETEEEYTENVTNNNIHPYQEFTKNNTATHNYNLRSMPVNLDNNST